MEGVSQSMPPVLSWLCRAPQNSVYICLPGDRVILLCETEHSSLPAAAGSRHHWHRSGSNRDFSCMWKTPEPFINLQCHSAISHKCTCQCLFRTQLSSEHSELSVLSESRNFWLYNRMGFLILLAAEELWVLNKKGPSPTDYTTKNVCSVLYVFKMK